MLIFCDPCGLKCILHKDSMRWICHGCGKDYTNQEQEGEEEYDDGRGDDDCEYYCMHHAGFDCRDCERNR